MSYIFSLKDHCLKCGVPVSVFAGELYVRAAYLAETGMIQRAEQTGVGVVILVALHADQMPVCFSQRRKLCRVRFVALCVFPDRQEGWFGFLTERFPRDVFVHGSAGKQCVISCVSDCFRKGKMCVGCLEVLGELSSHSDSILGQVESCDAGAGMLQCEKAGQKPVSAADVKDISGKKSVILEQVFQNPAEEYTVIKRSRQKAELQILIPVIDKRILAVEIGRVPCPGHQPFLRLVKQFCQPFNVSSAVCLSKMCDQCRVKLGDPADSDLGKIIFYSWIIHVGYLLYWI